MPDLLWTPERPIVHRAEWATIINLAQTGLEQRITDRERPHHFVEFDAYLDDVAEVRRYRTYLFQNLNSVWRVPIWWEPHTLRRDTVAGIDELYGQFKDSDLVAGDTIVLFDRQGINKPHISTINGVFNGLITMDSAPDPEVYKAGSQFFKLQDMKMAAPPRFSRAMASFEKVQLSMRYAAQAAMGGANASVSTFQHSADPSAFALLDRRPLAPADGDFDAFIEPIDMGKVYENSSSVDPAAIFETRRYSIRSWEELQFWEKFLDTIVGAVEPFYTPTYRPDLIIDTQPSGPSWDTIKIKDESDTVADAFDYVGQYFPETTHKQLRLETNLGEQYAEVSTAVDNMDGTNSLTFASGLASGTVISAISFLERVRLMDIATFEHHGTISKVTIGIKLTPRHPNE